MSEVKENIKEVLMEITSTFSDILGKYVEDTLKNQGNVEEDSQRLVILNRLNSLTRAVDSIEQEDIKEISSHNLEKSETEDDVLDVPSISSLLSDINKNIVNLSGFIEDRSMDSLEGINTQVQTENDHNNVLLSEIASKHGLSLVETGGDIKLWSKNDENTYTLISNENSASGSPDLKLWSAGRYGVEGGFVEVNSKDTFYDAIMISIQLPSPDLGNETYQEDNYDSLEEAIQGNNALKEEMESGQRM